MSDSYQYNILQRMYESPSDLLCISCICAIALVLHITARTEDALVMAEARAWSRSVRHATVTRYNDILSIFVIVRNSGVQILDIAESGPRCPSVSEISF